MAKRLIVCCDGTWNTADQTVGKLARPTNVTKLALSIPRTDRDGVGQVVYYHRGVGTDRKDRFRGGMFGAGLDENVLDAYRFLVDNYSPDDELWFFGFSRGAYTARSVSGMVRNCGILRPDSKDRIEDAYALYRSRAHTPSGVAATLFRASFSHPDGRIRFIGVWDTVGALGIPVPNGKALRWFARRFDRRYAFHDTELSTHVDGAFHALAIDEKRAVFAPTLWKQQPGAGDQVLEQVWFTGVHCDVGGGYAEHELSDITLRWMFEKARGFGLEITEPPTGSGNASATQPGSTVDFSLGQRDPLGEMHESRKSFYRAWRPLHRPIGSAPSGNEYLGTSVQERWKGDDTYRPENLVSYMDSPGVKTMPT